MARLTVVTPEKITELKTAFAIGCTDEEACAFANIGTSSFYRHLEDKPELREEFDRLKVSPILKAKDTVVKALRNAKDAQWYLERKAKHEFATRTDITTDDQPINITTMNYVPKQDETSE